MTRTIHTLALVLLVAMAAVAPHASAATFDELLPQVAPYDYDKDAAPLEEISNLMIQSQADPAALHAMAAQLAAQLPQATDAAKLFICRQIYLFGDDACIDNVTPLLLKKETSDMGCYALGRMPGIEATKALVAALAAADAQAKVAILNTIGQRREPDVVDVLAKAATDTDPAVARAATLALGLVGTPSAGHALENLWTPQTAKTVEAAALDAAEQMAKNEPSRGSGAQLYQKLLDNSQDPAVRGAALKALALLRGPVAALDLIGQGVKNESIIIQTAAIEAYRELDESTLSSGASGIANLSPAVQVMAINVLADRAVPGTSQAVEALVSSPDAAVRLAAIEALGKMGGSVTTLAQIAASDDADAAKAARNSLAFLSGTGVDDAMAAALESGDAKVRAEVLQAMGDRLAYNQVPTILKAATDPEEALRQNAFKTLARLASETDLPAMVDLLVKETDEAPRTQAETAIVSVAKRAKDPAARTAAVLIAWPATGGNVPARCALARVLGKLGDDSTLDLLRADVASSDAALQEAALRAMAEWPAATPIGDLQKIAESAEGTLKQLALRGYLRLAGLPSDRPIEQTAALYEKGLAMATEPGEKVAALAGLSDCPCDSSIAILKRYLDDAQVAAEAKLALDKVGNAKIAVTASNNPDEANNAIDGKPETRWSTNAEQVPGQWFQVDLLWPARVEKIILDATASAGDCPSRYEVYVSGNGQDWGESVAKGAGDKPVMEIACTPKSGRYVRIVQVGQKSQTWWSIHELKVQAERSL